MSRRFGRQQKRKLREQLQMEQGLREWYVDKYKKTSDLYTEIVERLEKIHPYCLLTPVKQIFGNPDNFLDYSVPMMETIEIRRYEGAVPEKAVFDVVKLHRLDVTLGKDISGFDHILHLKIGGRDKVGYYLSDAALYQEGVPVHHIAKEIARLFMQEGHGDKLK